MNKELFKQLIDKIYEEKEQENLQLEPHYIVRTYSMGVFYGIIDKSKSTDTMIVLNNSRRIWHWQGAASLSELATDGTCKPDDCKFPCVVSETTLTSPQGFEIILMTERAVKSLNSVVVWTAKND